MGEKPGTWGQGGSSWMVLDQEVDANPEGTGLAAHDLYVYAIDLASAWVKGGVFHSYDMETTWQRAMKQGADARVYAAEATRLAKRCAASARADMVLVGHALGMAMTACTLSPAFSQVIRDRGGVDGHWLFFVFTAADGTTEGLVSFASCAKTNFLDEPSFNLIVAETLREHLREGAELRVAMDQAGGVVLHESMRRLLPAQ